jgi:hypothetical protein
VVALTHLDADGDGVVSKAEVMNFDHIEVRRGTGFRKSLSVPHPYTLAHMPRSTLH